MFWCVTAIGGGTLREVLLGQFPPFVFRNDTYIYVAAAGSFLTYIFIEHYKRVRSIALLADALGLNLVSIGAKRSKPISPGSAVILGVITAVAGG